MREGFCRVCVRGFPKRCPDLYSGIWKSGRYTSTLFLCLIPGFLLSSSCLGDTNPGSPDVSGQDKETLRQSFQVYQQILKEQPRTDNAARAQYRIALTQIELGEIDAGLVALRKTVTDYPRCPFAPMALAALASYHRQHGKPEEANSLENELVQKYPETIETQRAWRDRGLTLFSHRKFDEAQTAFEKILKSSGKSDLTAEASLRIGYCLLARGKNSEAVACYQKVLNDFPTSAFAPESLGVLTNLYHQQKQPDKVEALRQRLVRDYSGVTSAAPVFMQIGYFLRATHKESEAIPYFVRGVLADPDPQRLRTVAGMLSAMPFKAIESAYNTILDKNVAAPYVNLHRAFANLSQNRSNEALSLFRALGSDGVAESALIRNPKSEIANPHRRPHADSSSTPMPRSTHTPTQSVPWDVVAVASLHLANHQRDSGQVKESIGCYQTILKTSSEHGKDFLSARYHLAIALHKANRLEDAIVEFDRVFHDAAKVETCAQAGLELARIQKEQKQAEKAMATLDQIVQRFEALGLAADAQVMRAYLCEVQGKSDEAEKALVQASLAHPEVADYAASLRLRLAQTLLQDGKTADAIGKGLAHLRKLEAEPTSCGRSLALEVADWERMYGDASRAVPIYERLLRESAKDINEHAVSELKLAYAFGHAEKYEAPHKNECTVSGRGNWPRQW